MTERKKKVDYKYRKPTSNAAGRAKNNLVFFVVYTAVFLCMAAIVFRPFWENGRSFVWDKDGLYQTFATMEYYSRYWKEFFHNLFVNHRFVLPMVDYSVGLGFDVMTTLNHYGFGDILLLLAIPFKSSQMEFCYGLIAILRFYLAGLTFSCFCIYTRRSYYPALIGAILYSFCGYALYAGVRHPYFLNSMIYFPLMLVGIEQILKKRSGLLLSFTVGIAASSNFYFMYMLTILAFLYAVLRFFSMYGDEWKIHILAVLLKGISYYILGIGLASIFLFPSIAAFLGNARSGIKPQFASTMFSYEGWFYKELLYGFFFPEFSADYWVVLSYGGITAFGLAVLMMSKGKYSRFLKLILVLLTLILWVPAGGLVMNGFSYVSHRWIYGYSFFMALTVVYALEKADRIPMKKGIRITLVLPVMAVAGLLLRDMGDKRTLLVAMALALVAGAAFLLIIWRGKTYFVLACSLALVSGCAMIGLNANLLYAPEFGDYVSQFHLKGENLPRLTDCPEKAAREMEDGTFYRVNGGSMDVTNSAMLTEIYGINGFFSIVSNDVYQYMKQMEMDDVKFPNWFYGFGGRAPLETLASVRYYTPGERSEKSVPYGYVERGEGLYENQLALPVGYLYYNVMPETEFQGLSAVRKQQAMMQAAVLTGREERMGDALEYTEQELPYTVSSMDNLTWNQDDQTLAVGEGGGDLYLSFQGLPDCETYLRFDNYDINESGYELLTVNIECGDGYWKKFYEASTKSVWYGDFHNFIVNLGYSREGKDSVHINFPFEGTFKLDGFQIYCMSGVEYKKQALELRQNVFQDTEVDGNIISGRADLERDGVLLLSVPYSKGWRAKVDGERAEVVKANLMYMAIPLKEGSHKVELSYTTPGLKAGCVSFCISLIAVCCLLKIGYTNKRRI